MSPENIAILTALIGVGGTVLGTVVGYILAKLDFGRLHFYFLNTNDIANNFEYSNTYYTQKRPCRLLDMNVKFQLRIYNSSDKNKVIHDCQVLLMNYDKVLQTKNIIDPSTIKSGSGITTADKITTLNIKEKTAINIPVDIKFNFKSNNTDEMLQANRVVLRYKKIGFIKTLKQKEKVIKRIDISRQPKFKEETTNEQS